MIDRLQVFRKADPNAIDLISKLLEYTPTQRLSAIDAMAHPFFDELRDPSTRLPDSRHLNGPNKELPTLYDFSLHGESRFYARTRYYADIYLAELSIRPDLNEKLVPQHIRPVLAAKGLDITNLQPMTKEQMMARLD